MSGSILRSEVIPAAGRIVVGPSNLFFIRASTANVTVRFMQGGTEYGAIGVGAGYIKRNRAEWERLTIEGTPGVAIEFFVGTEAIAEDDTDYRAQIATISGVTLITEQPAAALSTPAAVNVNTASASTIAANLLRRRITLGAPSTNTGSMFVQQVGAGAGRGLELQPGIFIEVKNTVALDVRNDSGATQAYTIFEES